MVRQALKRMLERQSFCTGGQLASSSVTESAAFPCAPISAVWLGTGRPFVASVTAAALLMMFQALTADLPYADDMNTLCDMPHEWPQP